MHTLNRVTHPPTNMTPSLEGDKIIFASWDTIMIRYSPSLYYMKDYQDPDPPACGLPPTIAHCPMVGL